VTNAEPATGDRAIGGWRSYGPYAARPMEGEPAVRVSGLTLRYEGRAASAVDELSLEIARGECVLLVGDNGAGKSSFLKMVAGLLTPSAGSAAVFGLPIGWCRASVAYVPQRGELDWDFPIDVRSLVATGRHVHRGWFGRMAASDRQAIDGAIDRLGLNDLRRSQIGQLSGGQQQRALVARALAQDAELLLVDEPTNSMDASSVATLARALGDCVAAGRTVVMATHDAERFRGVGTRIIRLERGRIAAEERCR
jgi:ABC-type Mn2+/Zn2+ transport system ATPase subunit